MRTKRIDLIERYIEEEKLVSLDVLCEKFAVSKNTIRRDIEELVKKGVVEKVYGGVSFKVPPSDTPLVRNYTLYPRYPHVFHPRPVI